MGRKPCCDKVGLKKGPWTAEEDKKLINFLVTYGQCCWRTVPELAGLSRCGKSCRLRWTNYLRPDLKRGVFSESEEKLIIDLHSRVGNRWSQIASYLPGRTDNEIKNYWNTHIKRKLLSEGIDPQSHLPLCQPYNSNNTGDSQSVPDHEIPVFQNPTTPEIADFFRYDRSESSPIEPAVLNPEEHSDLNLNLCISLPSTSAPASNKPSSVDRITMVSNPAASGCGLLIPSMLEGWRYDERKNGES